MRRTLLPLAILLVTVETLSAQPGSTGLSFLKLGVGARALGMGEAYVAVASDPSATYYNPAGLMQLQEAQILLMHKEWIQDTRTEFLGATTRWNEFAFGVSVNATSVENIEIRSIPGPPAGTFAARNTSIGISAAYALDSNFDIGLTGKFLYEKILTDEASGFALDFGGLYNTPWNLRLGFVVDNLGSISELDQQASELPTVVRAGGAYEIPIESLEGRLTLSSDIVSLSGESKTHLLVGSEFDYRSIFKLRAGYQTDYESRNFSAGVGIRYGTFSLDYAFVPFKYELGTTHTFSLCLELQ